MEYHVGLNLSAQVDYHFVVFEVGIRQTIRKIAVILVYHIRIVNHILKQALGIAQIRVVLPAGFSVVKIVERRPAVLVILVEHPALEKLRLFRHH